MVDSAASPLVLVDSGYYMSGANRKTDGGAGLKSWTFRPSRAGTATVSLVHVPPSHPGIIGDTTRFHVVIR